MAREQGWPVLSYAAVYDVVQSIGPAMATAPCAASQLDTSLLPDAVPLVSPTCSTQPAVFR